VLSLAWVGCAAAASVLAVIAIRQVSRLIELRRQARAALEGAGAGSPASAGAREAGAERLLASASMALRARAHAEQGDFRQAIRYLFLATLSRLEETRHITYVPHKTNGAYLREVAGRADIVRALRSFSRIFDRSWYGESRPERGEFDVASTHYEQVLRATG
jgi:hypothetical protein